MGSLTQAAVLRSLKGDRAFQRLRKGRSGGAKHLSLRWRPAQHGEVRVGIVVSGKVGKAVVRNRVRRRLRAALAALLAEGVRREACHGKAPSFDMVIIARRSAAEAGFWELRKALEGALTRASVR
ncbi:MAG: ribonuclease P protein component [Deinococcales bacterium]